VRRMTWGVAAVAAAVAGLGLVACGDDSGSSSASTAPSASAAPETSASSGSGGTLTVTASEPAEGKYAFDVPAEIQGGAVQVTFNNTGKEGHELGFVKLAEGTTAQEFADAVLGSPDGSGIPDYVLGAPGGVGEVAPGGSSTSTISLDEGTYAYFCTLGDPSHYTAGMLGEVTVKGTANTDALPQTTAEVDASEYKFDVNGLKAGENTLTFANKGSQFHHLIAVPLNEGATLDDVKTFLGSDNPTGPPPVDFEKEQSLAVTGPGQAQVTTLHLDSGSYVFLCFLNDKTGGAPHFTKGMLQQIDIG
jgi:plastocyanin